MKHEKLSAGPIHPSSFILSYELPSRSTIAEIRHKQDRFGIRTCQR